MLFFLAYVLIFGGATVFTAGILGRFTYRGRVVFELTGMQKTLVFVLGVLMLITSILLYVYASGLE